MKIKAFLPLLLLLFFAADTAFACTSMIVSGNASADGRPILWKHRDTGADNNFLARVEPKDGSIGYVGLFNGGDSLLTEAWMGMNDAGFAIMNTASYNLAPDTAAVKDREGVVMALALSRCTTVDEFAALLESLPKPMGVQANFGVIDAHGGAAYFETDDFKFTRFDVADSPSGVIIRSNYSFSGEPEKGYGYIRYDNASALASDAINTRSVTPQLLTEGLSRSFYHSAIGRDCSLDQVAVNQDFIPRDISTSSIAIEGINEGMEPTEMLMWANLGYPPCGITQKVTLTEIPEGFRAQGPEWRSPACDEAMKLRLTTFPFEGGSGKKYIDFRRLNPINETNRTASLENYRMK